jgi:hypothetical protein
VVEIVLCTNTYEVCQRSCMGEGRRLEFRREQQ